jgi:quinol monooxygenase YgiN
LEDLMLRSLLALVSLLLPIAPAFGQTAPAANPNAAANIRVVYFEVAPADVNRVAAALKDYRQASMRAPGALRVEVLQQVGRANHFAIYESWRDNAGLTAHGSSADVKKLDSVLQVTRVSPIDERLLSVIGPPSATVTGTGGLYVITHADSVPPSRDAAAAALTDLATRTRQEAGNTDFLVTVQPNRNNHFTIVEVWKDEKALDAHAVADHTKKFRDTFGPFSGALFDERVYKSVG